MKEQDFRAAMAEAVGALILVADQDAVHASVVTALCLNGADEEFVKDFLQEAAKRAFHLAEFRLARSGVELDDEAEEARQKCAAALGISLDD